jgi:hypothetical protein
LTLHTRLLIAMPLQKTNAIRIANGGKADKKSRVRAQFDTLVKQLETERKRLAAWHDAVPLLCSRVETELRPLSRQYDARSRELAFMFDKVYESKQVTKKERDKLSDLICDMTMPLLDADDDALSELFEKHSWAGAEDVQDDPEFAAFSEVLDQLPVTSENQEEQQASLKEAAHQKRLAAEELRLQQSVRDIFRKLSNSLHSDRERDPAEHDRTMALMQRANAAYSGNDWLGLLELQFEVEQIDAASLHTLPEKRIKQYNKLLTRQVAQVRRDIAELEQWLSYKIGVIARGRHTPALMEKSLCAAIAEQQNDVLAIEQELRDFQDIKLLKAFLKTYRIPDFPSMFDTDLYN